MKKKIAVFPAGSEVGLEINQSLRQNKHFELIGMTSASDFSSCAFECLIEGLPFYWEPNFKAELTKLIKENKISFIIPTMDEIGFLLKQIEAELDCEVVFASLITAKILRKKSSTYKALKDIIPVPDEIKIDNNTSFPVFCKPDIGYGSRGAEIIQDRAHASVVSNRITQELLFLEYLPGEEFTIDCFSDSKSALIYCSPRRRSTIKSGISVCSSSVSEKLLEQYAKNISEKLKMSGAWFFQVKKSSDSLFKLLEVGSRIAGSSGHQRLRGVNLIALDLYQRMGQPISILKPLEFVDSTFRSLTTCSNASLKLDVVHVDLDDCLINQGKINSHLISFLFEAINLKIKIILITRRTGDLAAYLRTFKILELFDEIIQVPKTKNKSEYVQGNSPLFIDDSFAEIREVQKNTNAICLLPEMICNGLIGAKI